MKRPADSQDPTSQQEEEEETPDLRVFYLTTYNICSCFLWGAVIAHVVLTVPYKVSLLHHSVNTLLTYTQTLALLEPLHSLTGLVRAPLFTTVMQVASRFLLVYGVIRPFPQLTTDEKFGGSWAHCSMVIAWSVTEVVRYAFFATTLQGSVPGVLKWLRYNLFFVLYPMGIGSECWLVYLAATGPGRYIEIAGVKVEWMLWAVLAVYVPGRWKGRRGCEGALTNFCVQEAISCSLI